MKCFQIEGGYKQVQAHHSTQFSMLFLSWGILIATSEICVQKVQFSGASLESNAKTFN